MSFGEDETERLVSTMMRTAAQRSDCEHPPWISLGVTRPSSRLIELHSSIPELRTSSNDDDLDRVSVNSFSGFSCPSGGLFEVLAVDSGDEEDVGESWSMHSSFLSSSPLHPDHHNAESTLAATSLAPDAELSSTNFGLITAMSVSSTFRRIMSISLNEVHL